MGSNSGCLCKDNDYLGFAESTPCSQFTQFNDIMFLLLSNFALLVYSYLMTMATS